MNERTNEQMSHVNCQRKEGRKRGRRQAAMNPSSLTSGVPSPPGPLCQQSHIHLLNLLQGPLTVRPVLDAEATEWRFTAHRLMTQ